MMDRNQVQQSVKLDQVVEQAASQQPQPALTGVEIEERAMRKCIARHEANVTPKSIQNWTYPEDRLEEAYTRCGVITADFAKTFYLGTQLMAPEKARAVWAIYVWCRRTDELVDGPNADRITPQVRLPSPAVPNFRSPRCTVLHARRPSAHTQSRGRFRKQ